MIDSAALIWWLEFNASLHRTIAKQYDEDKELAKKLDDSVDIQIVLAKCEEDIAMRIKDGQFDAPDHCTQCGREIPPRYCVGCAEGIEDERRDDD
jgi:hypothetical protein